MKKVISKIWGIGLLMLMGITIFPIHPSLAIQDTRLQMLSISPEGTGLSPAFSGDCYQYEMTVDNDVTSIQVEAKPMNENYTVEITGSEELKEGSNLVKIKVIGEQEESSSYSLFVTRKSPLIGEMEIVPNVIEKKEDQALQVTGIILDEKSNLFIHPEYRADIHDYTMELKGETTSIPLTVVANKQSAKIEIKGNENLVDGVNLIDILVKEGEESLSYHITVYKNVAYPSAIEVTPQLIEEPKNRKLDILYFSLAILVIMGIGIGVAKLRKREK